MNLIASNKIKEIEDLLHKHARTTCPRFMDVNPCENCDIECPYDMVFSLFAKVRHSQKLPR